MNKAFPKTMIKWKLNFVRKYFVLPPTFKKRHSRAVWLVGYIPTRVQTLVVAGHCLMNLLMVSIGYANFKPNMYLNSSYLMHELMLSHRTAIMSFGQIPLLIIFASRNNLLAMATGWSFDTFNVYHRWVSRTMFIHAAIHSVCWADYGARRHYISLYYAQPYFRWGVAATCIGAAILFQAWQFLRSRWYETFLLIHIILAAAYIAGCYVHVDVNGFGYTEFLWPAIALWVFDRFFRLVRMGLNGGLLKTSFEMRGTDVFRADISYWKTWTFYPGAHVYIYVMLPSGFWQSHPFTVFESNLPGEEGHIIILGKKKHGLTETIYKRLLNAECGKKDLRIFVEGPYGSHHHLGEFDTAVLIAGGIGITAIFPYALDLKARGQKQHIVIRWVVHSEDALTWMPDELNSLLADGTIDFKLHITSSDPSKLDKSLSDDSSADNEKQSSSTPSLNIVNGRPDMEEMVTSAISLYGSDGSVGVLVCGPPAMNDDVRASVANNLENAKGKVEYFEEAFAW